MKHFNSFIRVFACATAGAVLIAMYSIFPCVCIIAIGTILMACAMLDAGFNGGED